MARQTLVIDCFGMPTTAYKDDNPVDLGALFGDQEIGRFSEVCHSHEHQRFTVVFRETAPVELYNIPMTSEHLLACGYAHEEYTEEGVALFTTYSNGILAEQAYLEYLMLTGAFHALNGKD